MELKILQKEELRKCIAVVVGTRPGIIKFAPVVKRLEKSGTPYLIIHTGQHYSFNMDRAFFEDLELPAPLCTLESVRHCKYHGEQTAEMLKGIERALISEKPAIVIVGGDANTNLSGALAARKLGITLAHMEAGLRSDDWTMPEEQNRVMIDHISDILFAPTEHARQRLAKDNVRGKIVVTGNPIVDAVKEHVDLARKRSRILEVLDLPPDGYFLVTMHREENVDSKQKVSDLCETLSVLATERAGYPIVFPVHPRTATRLDHFGKRRQLEAIKQIKMIDPIGYLDFLRLLSTASLVLTDSGGIQEESCILRVPCITLRENTERPETVEVGSNIVATTRCDRVLSAVRYFLEKKTARNWPNPFGEDCAQKIVDYLRDTLNGNQDQFH
jgi:UDP-N-acetylglucosamine 2-epimerase (non-hydrolysing)